MQQECDDSAQDREWQESIQGLAEHEQRDAESAEHGCHKQGQADLNHAREENQERAGDLDYTREITEPLTQSDCTEEYNPGCVRITLELAGSDVEKRGEDDDAKSPIRT